ncbi:MAG: putative toxin-antitoxin system toxin component, PIN family [Burkholderiales bacterium]
MLLSALHTDGGPPAKLLEAWYAGRFRLVTSREQIAEFKRAARYAKLRKILPWHAIGQVVNRLRQAEVMLSRLRRVGDSPDPGDDYLLAMAAAAGADYLVTGDKALMELKRFAVTRIVSARRFASILAP